MMSFFKKNAFCILLSLTLISHSHGKLKLCNLELETCGAKPEFNEYTFSALISDSYDSVLDYFGVNQESTDNGSYTEDNTVDAFDFFGIQQEIDEQSEGNSETGDELIDSGIDALLKQAKGIAAMMSEGHNSLDDLELYTGMIHEAMSGTTEENQINKEKRDYQHEKETPSTGKEPDEEDVEAFIKQANSIVAMMSDEHNSLDDIHTLVDNINESKETKEETRAHETGDYQYDKQNLGPGKELEYEDDDDFIKQALDEINTIADKLNVAIDSKDETNVNEEIGDHQHIKGNSDDDLASIVSGGQGIKKGDIDMFADILREAFDQFEDPSAIGETSDFEYLPMTRLDPGKVGQVRTIDLPDGRKTTIKTLAKQPPIFEIEQFLTAEESDLMLEGARRSGPIRSAVFVRKAEQENGDQISAVRQSYSSALEPPHVDEEFLDMIKKRVSTITNIPMYVLKGSESISIGHYKPGGHYSAHLDSNEASRKKIPCCFQKSCTDSSGTIPDAIECCTICRYVTFLYYLKDVEGGGETAFPFADLSMADMLERRESVPDWQNLTKHCHKANVVVKPAKGKAIFWYNHFLDSKGYLGGVDKRGFHGGCNVTEGSKWIATNWISTPIYSHRFRPSRWVDNTLSYKQYIESQRH